MLKHATNGNQRSDRSSSAQGASVTHVELEFRAGPEIRTPWDSHPPPVPNLVTPDLTPGLVGAGARRPCSLF